MYKDHNAIVRHIGDDGNNRSYTDMLEQSEIEYTILDRKMIIELSPGHIKFVDLTDGKLDGRAGTLRIGKYRKGNSDIYFIELGIDLGRGVINHTTIIYSEMPDASYLKAIEVNYLNLIITDATEEVY